MNREMFKDINDSHKTVAETIRNQKGRCDDVKCESCPFCTKNSVSMKGCSCFLEHKDLAEAAQEFLDLFFPETEMQKHDTHKVRFDLFDEKLISECVIILQGWNMAGIIKKLEATCGGEENARYEMHRVYSFGAEKYGAFNWQKDCDKQRFYNAFCRHERAYRRGEIINKEDGDLLHLAQMIFNLIAFDYHSKKEAKKCQD